MWSNKYRICDTLGKSKIIYHWRNDYKCMPNCFGWSEVEVVENLRAAPRRRLNYKCEKKVDVLNIQLIENFTYWLFRKKYIKLSTLNKVFVFISYSEWSTTSHWFIERVDANKTFACNLYTRSFIKCKNLWSEANNLLPKLTWKKTNETCRRSKIKL